jgi:hypothetical protein
MFQGQIFLFFGYVKSALVVLFFVRFYFYAILSSILQFLFPTTSVSHLVKQNVLHH